MRPIALSIIRMFTEKETDKALRVLIRASVRFMIAGGAKSAVRSGTVEETLATIAKQISDGTIRNAAQLLQQLETIVPNDTKFKEAFAVAAVGKNPPLARYYLRSLTRTHRRQRHALYLEKDAVGTLEHVLPVNPGMNWPHFSDEEADVFNRRIGNLALLNDKDNSDLKSRSFSDKRKVLSASTDELTAQIGKLDDWTKDRIAERQRAMAALAVKTWALSAD